MMLKVIGRIRPGTKVLKRSITDPKAKQIVERGILAGVGYPAIDSALTKAGFKHALVPKNEPFFSVWPGEFKNPETAKRILDLYGEQREGDLVKKLYEFPVVFPHSDPAQMVMTRMECYTAKGLKYHSEINGNGDVLCITKDDVPKVNGRAIRIYGGRKDKVRGHCDPEHCPEYQKRECNVRSKIHVMIPGEKMTAELVEIPTGSFYAVDDIENTLRYTAALCGGKVPVEVQMGWKGQPIFWMTKVREKVKHMTDEGDTEMVPQIIAHLNCKAELAHLLAMADAVAEKHRKLSTAFLPQGAAQAPAALEHQPALRPEDFVSSNVVDMAQARAESVVPAEQPSAAPIPEAAPSDHQPEQTASEPAPAPEAAQPTENTEDIAPLRQQASRLCKQVGLNPVDLLEYGNARFGTNWGKTLKHLNAMVHELKQALESDDVEGYIAEVNNVIFEERQRNTESA
ncbi:hypothetical protein [Acidithiobacillus thiooxidans]|nr:hypothetical protein [Acidithiobacillus thiooxidans]